MGRRLQRPEAWRGSWFRVALLALLVLPALLSFTLVTRIPKTVSGGSSTTGHRLRLAPLAPLNKFKRPVSSELKQQASSPPARQPNLETEQDASGEEGDDVQDEAYGITGNAGEEQQVEVRNTATVGEEPQVEERNAAVVGAEPQVEVRNAAIVSEEPQGKPRNVAIGVAKGLKAEAIATYLQTLRKWSSPDVYLYVDKVPEGMGNSSGISFLEFRQEQLPAPWNRYHPSSYRYYLYDQFMKHAGKDYHKVQACDIRDVAFQNDPFSIVVGTDEVHVFEEDAGMNIGKCGVNSGWIRACYGHPTQMSISGQPISCSGYAIGTSAAMGQYFANMAGEIGTNTRCEQNGIDQGVHNVLVNARKANWKPSGKGYPPLPHFIFHDNERGPVFTGGYAPKGVYRYSGTGAFQNHDLVDYTVLHQYDRHVIMTEALQGVMTRIRNETKE